MPALVVILLAAGVSAGALAWAMWLARQPGLPPKARKLPWVIPAIWLAAIGLWAWQSNRGGEGDYEVRDPSGEVLRRRIVVRDPPRIERTLLTVGGPPLGVSLILMGYWTLKLRRGKR